MTQPTISKNKTFYCIGLSYQKADATMRGMFSLTPENKDQLLSQAKSEGFEELLVISTCNRTELYGYAEHPFQLIQLLCKNSNGSVDDFQKVGYVIKNKEAVHHLFEVGTGLDSQILGDFEIIGQIKQAFNLSRDKGLANAFLERLMNCVINASKRIKNETALSSGAASVSFTAVQYIMQNIPEVLQKNILLFGVGKIGRNTCENLIKHTQNEHITLINRTREKAEQIAGKFNVIVKDFNKLRNEISKADVLIVATGAATPTVYKDFINPAQPILILDLSIPKNVEEQVATLPNVTLLHMDELSKRKDEALERRKEAIPQALEIVEEVKEEFFEWLDNRKFAPTIKALKAKLESLKEAEMDFQRKKIENFNEQQAEMISNRIIQKITTQFVNHLKDTSSIDESISWVQEVFQLEV
ncbi:glutamyl-tRNA reductase [Capnocytophaga ochracea F0287]|uniref:Glutamyl-tRNA reductase n=1 Tax=Capnocytophaga ochracea F0287 TaxID=873517 RepID=E4MNR8_CAPOC|nr:glutamyl-tRNA reductase [Capnocytophaga ochracea]EFS98675.1 glutamyl-tRNA reductase [Capnocytophaga ochracea F0287]EJF45168.1 glutamyl-tRNA reductase [Capnocytophaga ochracea str. Holt 25]UEB43090.1 glutamyl-tRNA reductase [Capnocytophaga ochracea]